VILLVLLQNISQTTYLWSSTLGDLHDLVSSEPNFNALYQVAHADLWGHTIGRTLAGHGRPLTA
ncbi:MAG: hypothetical protein ACKPKO_51190, partial [Candidatus Fonsibacter sp.]